MDKLQSMMTFEQVVAQNGFAAAARKLDIAPSVVTVARPMVEITSVLCASPDYPSAPPPAAAGC